MPKALLVVDMPENCSKCPFMYEFNGFKRCHLINCICMANSVLPLGEITRKRADMCPLREL